MFFLASGGLKWVDRGDSDDYDFAIGDLTVDTNWNDLDLSSIVGSGVSNVLLRWHIRATSADEKVYFRTKGNTNSINIARADLLLTNKIYFGELFITTNASGVIEYTFNGTVFDIAYLLVRGWFK